MIKNINNLIGELIYDLDTGKELGIIEWIEHKAGQIYNLMYRDRLTEPNFLEIEVLDKDPRSLN